MKKSGSRPRRASVAPPGGHRYSMAEIEARTGVDREAVRFYIREHLLPEPAKTARTRAWYSDRHVELIHLIRSLQQEHFLPLKAIRALLYDASAYEFSPRQRQVFELILKRLRRMRKPSDGLSVASLLASLGLDGADAEAMRRRALLRTPPDRAPDSDEAGLLRDFALLRKRGRAISRKTSVADLDIVQAAVDLLFDQELRIFLHLSDLPDAAAERLAEDFLPVINRLFARLHERKLRDFLERLRARRNPARTRP